MTQQLRRYEGFRAREEERERERNTWSTSVFRLCFDLYCQSSGHRNNCRQVASVRSVKRKPVRLMVDRDRIADVGAVLAKTREVGGKVEPHRHFIVDAKADILEGQVPRAAAELLESSISMIQDADVVCDADLAVAIGDDLRGGDDAEEDVTCSVHAKGARVDAYSSPAMTITTTSAKTAKTSTTPSTAKDACFASSLDSWSSRSPLVLSPRARRR